jgi:hypothetical protein
MRVTNARGQKLYGIARANRPVLRNYSTGSIVVAPAFTPSSVSGLILWFDADLGVTDTGGNVSSWQDQSASAALWEVISAGEEPVISAGVNGNGRVTFDDTDDMLFGDVITHSTVMYVYVAMKPTSTSVAGEYREIVCSDLSGGSPLPPILYLYGGVPGIFWGTGANKVNSAHTLSTTTPSIVRFRLNVGTAVGVRVNDNSEETASHSVSAVSGWQGLGDVGGGEPMGADLYEVIIVHRNSDNLSASDDSSIMSYLNEKVGAY